MDIYKNFPTKIGIACIINKNDRVLLGKRLNSHGHETWAFPGGHLEEGESPFDCALRETAEETGLLVKNPAMLTWSFDTFIEKEANYITLFVATDFITGEPELKEPDKCERWDWFTKDKLPEPLFSPVTALLNFGYTIE